MRDKLLPRQLCALAFCAFTVPAVGLLPRAGWLWALIAAVCCAAVLAVGVLLTRKKGGSAAALAAQSGLGKTLLAPLLLWNFLALGMTARYLCGAYPDAGGFPLTGALLLLLAAYAANKGVSAVARVSAICFFFLIALYALVLGFAAPQLRPQWLTLQTKPVWTILPAVFSPVCVLFLTGHCTERGKSAGWLFGGMALAFLAAFVAAGCLSPEVAGAEPFAVYTVTKSLSLFGAMERFEALVSAALTAGGFTLLGLLCLTNAELIRALWPRAEKCSGVANFLLGFAGIFASGVLNAGISAAVSAIFWGILPIGILSLAKRKKY